MFAYKIHKGRGIIEAVRVMPHARKSGATLSENAFLYALAGLGYKGRMTGHGFRANYAAMIVYF